MKKTIQNWTLLIITLYAIGFPIVMIVLGVINGGHFHQYVWFDYAVSLCIFCWFVGLCVGILENSKTSSF
jgi:ABC-type polysaccharide/polyol phosphate export permease